MSVMVSEVYDALIEAGASEAKARAAASAVSEGKNLVSKTDLRAALAELKNEIIVKIGGMIVAAVAVLLAFDKLL